jgi:hypothetical protein
MICAPKILIYDDAIGDSPLVNALRTKFPDAELKVVADPEAACAIVRAKMFAVVVTHHAKAAALSLVWRIRDADPITPLIVVSDLHRQETARAAGANELLPLREWQRIGAVVEHLLAHQPQDPMHRQCA